MAGDLDDDFFPEAAFVANNAAEVVLNLGTTPTKLSLNGSGVVGADVGRAPGAEKYALIVAKLLSAKFVWSAVDIVTEKATVFAEVYPLGSPVVGCYAGNTYAPAVFVKSKSRPAVRMFASPADLTVPLPAGTVTAVCGMPEGGLSSAFALVSNSDAFYVTARNGSRTLFSSPNLDSRFRDIKLGTASRGTDRTPAPVVLARLGTKQVLRVLNRSNRWKAVPLPKVPVGSSFTALYGIRAGTSTYVVLQVMNKAKATSYVKVLVPAEML